jgi:hypothetical protein
MSNMSNFCNTRGSSPLFVNGYQMGASFGQTGLVLLGNFSFFDMKTLGGSRISGFGEDESEHHKQNKIKILHEHRSQLHIHASFKYQINHQQFNIYSKEFKVLVKISMCITFTHSIFLGHDCNFYIQKEWFSLYGTS